jgi:hypothetical protein
LNGSEIKPGRLALATAVVFVASADGPISPEAWGQVRSIVGADEELLEAAIDLARQTPLPAFLGALSEALNEDQKLCVLLNVFDSMWSDEVATPRQLEIFKLFRNALTVNEPSLDFYLKGIEIKNNVPSLDSVATFEIKN